MYNRLLTVVIAILVIIGGGVAAYMTDAFSLRTEIESRMARAGVQILEGEVHNRTLKEFTLFGEQVTPPPIANRLIDYTPSGYAITFNAETADWNVEALGTQQTLATGSDNKLWLSTSPSGEYLVFAERAALQTHGEVQKALAVYDPAQWNINVIETGNGKIRTELPGSMPRFFERDESLYLLYLAPNEVRVRGILGTWQEFVLPYYIDGLWPAEVSPDGKYLALFNMDRMSYDLFTFELTEGAIKLTPLPPMPVQVRILAFKGTDLYALAWLPDEERAELIVIDLEHPESFMVLSDRPGLEQIRKIIPAP